MWRDVELRDLRIFLVLADELHFGRTAERLGISQPTELSGAVRGLLRVGFVLTTEGPALSRLIAAFQARYPGCEVRLQEVETFDAYRALRRGDIDGFVQQACRRRARPH